METRSSDASRAWLTEQVASLPERARRLAEGEGAGKLAGMVCLACLESEATFDSEEWVPFAAALVLLVAEVERRESARVGGALDVLTAPPIESLIQALGRRRKARDQVNAGRHDYATRRNAQIAAFVEEYRQNHPCHGLKAAVQAAAKSGKFRRAPLSGGRGSDLVPTPCLSEDKIRQGYYAGRKQMREGKKE